MENTKKKKVSTGMWEGAFEDVVSLMSPRQVRIIKDLSEEIQLQVLNLRELTEDPARNKEAIDKALIGIEQLQESRDTLEFVLAGIAFKK